MKTAANVLWVIVGLPFVLGVLTLPFALMVWGVSLVTGQPLPSFDISRETVVGMGAIWVGLLILAGLLTAASEIAKDV